MSGNLTIKSRRGPKAHMPVLTDGELGFTTDTHQLYIGEGGVNWLIGPADPGSPGDYFAQPYFAGRYSPGWYFGHWAAGVVGAGRYVPTAYGGGAYSPGGYFGG